LKVDKITLPPRQSGLCHHMGTYRAWVSHRYLLPHHSHYRKDTHDHMFQDSMLNMGRHTPIVSSAQRRKQTKNSHTKQGYRNMHTAIYPAF